jgi:phosphoglycerate dehydrogenase-like enzyme
MSPTVWCNLDLPPTALASLEAGVGPHALVRAAEFAVANQPLGRPDPGLMDADIVVGQPEVEQCLASGRLRFVQLTSAGFTTFDTPAARAALTARQIPVCISSAVYSEPCAQHALAFLLAEARQLPRSIRDQATTRRWDTPPTRRASFLLGMQTVLLVGFGGIAKRLAELLRPFGLEVIGFRREPRGDEELPVYGVDELLAWLPQADIVVNTLPASDETGGFFDEAAFATMKPGAIFLNLGRGSTVDQPALARALDGHLRAAYLDVTTPEPLPPEDPLWALPNCHLTPHVAGGHGDEYDRVVAHFLGNLGRFQRGEPLLDRVY